MSILTIVVPNRNRFDLNSNATKYFFGSLERQSCLDFEIIVVDGGSSNFNEMQEYVSKGFIKKKIIRQETGKLFPKCLLNNIGIRNSNTKYIMTTDSDMLFGRDFIKSVIANLNPYSFVESRTMFLNPAIVDKIYRGEFDFFNNEISCKEGRIKKRFTCGGCQATSVENWNRLRGYNEKMIGWGPEDQELLKRAGRMGLDIRWLGETRESIMLFHQPHAKSETQHDEDVRTNEVNQKLFRELFTMDINANGWGGKC